MWERDTERTECPPEDCHGICGYINIMNKLQVCAREKERERVCVKERPRESVCVRARERTKERER